MEHCKYDLRRITTCLIVAALLLTESPPGFPYGIATRFSDVVMGNLQPGGVYNLRELKNVPFVVMNTGEEEVEILIEVYMPKPNEDLDLKKGYEHLPDPGWLKIIPERVRIPSKGTSVSDIILSIPDDKSLIGKNYQVSIWSHNITPAGAAGFMIGVGVISRLRFSIGAPIPEAIEEEKRRKKMLDLNLRLDPVSVKLFNFPVGRGVDLRKDRMQNVTIVNAGADKIPLKLQSVIEKDIVSPPSGYEYAPDPSWLKIKPERITVKPYTIVPLSVQLTIPDEPAHRGKGYMFLLKAEIEGVEVPLNLYTQILVRLQE